METALRARRPTLIGVFSLACRVLAGAALIRAALHPLGNRQALVAILNAYQILPDRLLNPVATVLPYVEIAVGVLLFLGLFTRTTAIWATALLGVFVAGLVEAHVRGLHIDCGCSLTPNPRTLISFGEIGLALLLLAAAAFVVWRPDGPFALDGALRHQDDRDDDGDDEVDGIDGIDD